MRLSKKMGVDVCFSVQSSFLADENKWRADVSFVNNSVGMCSEMSTKKREAEGMACLAALFWFEQQDDEFWQAVVPGSVDDNNVTEPTRTNNDVLSSSHTTSVVKPWRNQVQELCEANALAMSFRPTGNCGGVRP